MNQNITQNLVERNRELGQAYIQQNAIQRPQTVQKIVLALDAAKSADLPYEINFPFRSVFVEDASDSSTRIFMRPNTREDVQSFFALGRKDSWSVDQPISKAFLHWDAQAGKSITLVLFTEAEFKSGTQISATSGGVAIVNGSSIAQSNNTTYTINATFLLLPSDLDRKVATIGNYTDQSLFLGGASVDDSANKGIELVPGATIEWRNTAALYAFQKTAPTAKNILTLVEK